MFGHIDTQLVHNIWQIAIDPYKLAFVNALNQGIGSDIVFVIAQTNIVATNGIQNNHHDARALVVETSQETGCQKISSTKGDTNIGYFFGLLFVFALIDQRPS
jgi:hypothetical protein